MSEEQNIDPQQAQALEEQQTLAESSLQVIFEMYDDAIEDGTQDPVVVLIDCEDQLGAEIARAWLGDEAVEEAIALQASESEEESVEGETTVFAAAFSFEQCCEQVPQVFPYLSEVFQQPPVEDGVLVISITSGGASALTAPADARP